MNQNLARESLSQTTLSAQTNRANVDKQEDLIELNDFLIMLTLVAKISQDKKYNVLFDICDDDQDGWVTPFEFLEMLKSIERLYLQSPEITEVSDAI